MSKANKGQAGDKGEIVEPNPSKTRKIDQVIALLRRPEGATAAQISEATGWQAHSVRGAIAGQLRKALKLNVVTTKSEAGAAYRIVEGDAWPLDR